MRLPVLTFGRARAPFSISAAKTRPCDLLLNLEQELDLIDLSEHRWRGWHFDGIADAFEAQGFDGLDLTGGASDGAAGKCQFEGAHCEIGRAHV